jgi:hypothetical protein
MNYRQAIALKIVAGCLAAVLASASAPSWYLRAITPTCGDPDDIAVDEKRNRAYVSCGQGFIDVFQLGDSNPLRIARIVTIVGARTALYDPELDRFFLAVKATSGTPAAVWLYKPQGP